jgi:predicted Zn-dependent protease
MRLAWLLLLTTGCLYVGWDDVPNAKVHPEVHAIANETFDNQTYWSAQVANAVAIWNQTALEAGCPAPFAISDDPQAHPIRLVPRGAWPYTNDIVGMYVDEYADAEDLGYIVIRERRPIDQSHLPVLLHELGHAIGLTHDDHAYTIMNLRTGSVTQPRARDLARMRDALGC